jgi:Tfp pilus assembly protein PilN
VFGFLKKILGTKQDRDLKQYQALVIEINKNFEEYQSLSNDALRSKTLEFRARIREYLSEIDTEIATVTQNAIDTADFNDKEDLFKEVDELRKNRDKALEEVLMSVLPEDLAFEVLQRILVMDNVPREVLAAVEESLKTEFMRSLAQKNTRDSHELLAEIFNNFDRTNEQRFMGVLEKANPEDAERVRALMFTFDDIMKTDDKGIQTILRDVDKDILSLALKGAKPEMREKFLKNMSERAAKILKEDMEVMGPVKVKDVDEAQMKIVGVAKQLADRGEIVIISDGGDGQEEFIT